MKHCFALDLKDDAALIAQYEEWHRHVWPEIIASIKQSGITGLEIFRAGNRLFMIMEVDEQFSFAGKQAADEANPRVQEWEALMWKFQLPLPFAQPGQKWVLMDKIFDLKNNL